MIATLVRRSIAEAIADGALRAAAGWVAVFALLSPAISAAGIGAGGRVTADLGLAGTAALAGATGIGLGIRQIGVEIRARRAIAVLSRPVPLSVFVGSRLLGVGLVLALTTAASGSAIAAIAAWWGGSAAWGTDLATVWSHAVVLSAAAMAASSLARPGLAALAVSVLWPAAYLGDDAARIIGFPPLAWLVPSFDGAGAIGALHSAAWTAVYAAIATWGVGRTDRG